MAPLTTFAPPLVGGLGLSSGHISPRPFGHLRYAVGGGWCEIRAEPLPPRDSAPIERGCPRGRVSAFSPRSRSRLLARLAQVPRARWAAGTLLVTLTYPRAWSGDPSEWKRDLDTWLKRLVRARPGCAGVWKLEPQGRGAPHYHLLLWGAGYLPHAWVAYTWWDVLGRPSTGHLRAGTRVEAVRHSRFVGAYAAKYCGKAVLDAGNWPYYVGRWWGMFGREHAGIVLHTLECAAPRFFALRRVLRALLARRRARSSTAPARGRGHPVGDGRAGLWIFLSDSEAERLVALAPA